MNSMDFDFAEMQLVPIKKTMSANVYVANYLSEKFVLKECLNLDSKKRMCRTVRLFESIATSDTSFITAKPQKFFESEDCNIFIEKYVEGISLEHFALSESNEKIICQNLVRYLQSLRKVVLRTGFENFSWQKFFTNYIKEKLAIVIKSEIYHSKNLKDFLSYVTSNVGRLKSKLDLKLIHNDLNASNILIQKNFEVQAIDYEWWIVGDPLKDLSKILWYLRSHKKFGEIFKAIYEDVFGRIDGELLKFYFATDILNHLSQYETLIQNSVWKKYFQQEFEIVQEIWKENFCLWHQK